MSIECQKNRDLYFKIWFKFFLNNILKIFKIDEEIEEIEPTEYINILFSDYPRVKDKLLDFRVKCKSGLEIIFEFKKGYLRTEDLKQGFDYYFDTMINETKDVDFIFIVLGKGGNIKEYTHRRATFSPPIFKTKEINKQKDLNIIRDKIKDNKTLTEYECALYSSLPMFETGEDEADLVEELCTYIKENKNCFIKSEINKIKGLMYLNICEYVKLEKTDEVLEMIGMKTKFINPEKELYKRGYEDAVNEGINKDYFDGVNKGYEDAVNEGINKDYFDGIVTGETNLIKTLIKTYDIKELAQASQKSEKEILKMIGK